MPFQNLAADMLADAITGGASYNKFTNSNAYLGVGNSSTAHAKAQTDLQGASKTRKAMDATYPSRSTNVLTFRSTFATGDANHDWYEWGIFNAASGGQMLSRKAENLGTKTSAATWQFTVTYTINV
ncbi:MAG TPA: hypothetical protein PK593_04275 [Thermomicrobiales bacterium]|nr:hypothetical protein [Thermomicrobiales bacterium]HQZ91177.1 hypothetical protein [Thermomicrobiales bacterium]HRA32739.1 hypothetical protein [Thermomicrobiales bacterium]